MRKNITTETKGVKANDAREFEKKRGVTRGVMETTNKVNNQQGDDVEGNNKEQGLALKDRVETKGKGGKRRA